MQLNTPHSIWNDRTKVLLWIAAACVISQLPYRHVWSGTSTFMYDAFTTFSPWNVARLDQLRSGQGMLSVFQDRIPTELWPSYFFSGIGRQLAAFVQPNTPIAHAVVQAIHLVLIVPAVALLFRSMGIPFRFGTVGGVVFVLSGIHVSLTQHSASNEALLYLVLSLWCIRDLLLGCSNRTQTENALWFAATCIVMVSLVRVHHEAMLYFLPIAAWTAAHLGLVWQRTGATGVRTIAGLLLLMSVLVAIMSVPMLLTAYEMSLINKTLIHSYDSLGSYFADFRVFLLALVLPNFTGAAGQAWPNTFDFGQKGTLSYLFAGTLTAPLLAVVAFSFLERRQWRKAIILGGTLTLIVGFTFGAGNPVHRSLCAAFPFLIDIGHNYYGLHLLYLVTAFVVAEGIRILCSGASLFLFGTASLLFYIGVVAMTPEAPPPTSWGFSGDPLAYANAVRFDTSWLAGSVIAALLIASGAMALRRISANQTNPASNAGSHRYATAMLGAMALLIFTDHLRPVINAHFVPNRNFIAWLDDPIGGFNPSRPIVDFFESEVSGIGRNIRVLPLFIPPGGWQVNALMRLPVHLMSMPGDSGGSRHVSAAVASSPDQNTIQRLIEDYGVEYFWVARWEMDAWAAVISKSPSVELVFSAQFGGDVYRVTHSPTDAEVVSGVLHLPWRGISDTADQGIIAQTWTFALPGPRASDGDSSMVRLPLMWHAAYDVLRPSGESVGYTSDDLGRVLAGPIDRADDALLVRYPNRILTWLIGLSAAVYLSMIALAAVAALNVIRARRRSASSLQIEVASNETNGLA